MANRRAAKAGKKKIESYDHRDKKRANNPPVGLVTPQTDPDEKPRKYAFDLHLDPQLVWAGKASGRQKNVILNLLGCHLVPTTIRETGGSRV